MTIQDTRVVPNCRYGHGDLKKITVNYPGTNDEVRFSMVGTKNFSLRFVGNIYACTTCGYTEFFDDEPHVTAGTTSADSGSNP